jgi:hypothetical protein
MAPVPLRHLLVDHEPDSDDYALDLARQLAHYRTLRSGLHRIPDFALKFMAAVCRRALYAENLLEQIRHADSLEEVQGILESSKLPF